ncbi:uncharacterized protein LOC135687950 [Rhopilema esculentum]|uniref:uncharacterized protein LOC135687950 n=1 Tax=Rhopilema esculentum TaxID=499914 RepID=UPI0031E0A8AA
MKTKLPAGQFLPNGCSIPYGLPFPYKRTFTSYCNQHHYCYHYERSSRLGCDQVFYRNMLRKCKQRACSIFAFHDCVKYASVYYAAVRAGGGSHYG